MVQENEHGERDDSSGETMATRPRRHRAARRPAGPPPVHAEHPEEAPGIGATASELEGSPADVGEPVTQEAGDVSRTSHHNSVGESSEAVESLAGAPSVGEPATPEPGDVSGTSDDDSVGESSQAVESLVDAPSVGEPATQEPGDVSGTSDDDSVGESSEAVESLAGAHSDAESGTVGAQDEPVDDAHGASPDEREDATHDGPGESATLEPTEDGAPLGQEPDATDAAAEREIQGQPDVETAEPSATSSAVAGDGTPSEGSVGADEQPPLRRSRRATRGVVTAAFSSVAAEQPPQATRAADRPAPALFQAPDLTVTRAASSKPEGAPAEEPQEAEDEADSLAEGGGQTAPGRRSRRATRAAGAPHQIAEVEPGGASSSEVSEEPEPGAADDDDEQPRRRRRRGGRRRRRSGQGPEDELISPEDDGDGARVSAEPLEGAGERVPGEAGASSEGRDEASAEAGEDEEPGTGRRRRRRRRRAGVSEEMEDLSTDDPPNTVTKVREARRASDEVIGVRGSTRIEAKKQRRRDGREAGRRRAPILTEAEFLARREAVNRVMCVRQRADRTQIAVLEDGILVEHYVNRAESSSMVGNVYLGKVQNVLPSMEAAFVDIGRGRNAVLYAGEVNWDAAGLEGQPKRIELALKSGDPVLVQVTKDPIGHKGARLTSQISLPGRFLVYVPEGSMTGISRKLPDTERARLKGILKDVVPEGAGVIVRTAAEGATEKQLTADVLRLTDEWADIQRKAKSSTPPTLLYGEPDLAIKVVRDIFNEDFTTLLVQGASTARTLSDYVGRVAPDLLGRVEQWTGTEDLYSTHRIDEQLAKALDRKVWLPSGGSLVIDRTEAMTVVDVNTGKFTGQGGNLEETVTRNNLEAAEEIVRQLRLRDIGGIIVIDFIDMVLESNRDLVLRRLVECLGRDRTKHQVAEVTSLGLVQMTRKRIGQGLLEVFSTPCEACGGRGHIVHTEPVGSGNTEDNGARERGSNRRGQRPAPQVTLGGKQTGKTPPPPKFDEHGHIDHSVEHAAADVATHHEPQLLPADHPDQLVPPAQAPLADEGEGETLSAHDAGGGSQAVLPQAWEESAEQDTSTQPHPGAGVDTESVEPTEASELPAEPAEMDESGPSSEGGDEPSLADPHLTLVEPVDPGGDGGPDHVAGPMDEAPAGDGEHPAEDSEAGSGSQGADDSEHPEQPAASEVVV